MYVSVDITLHCSSHLLKCYARWMSLCMVVASCLAIGCCNTYYVCSSTRCMELLAPPPPPCPGGNAQVATDLFFADNY